MAALGVQRFINSSAVTSRAAEFTGLYSSAASTGPWFQTCNNGASNASGLGIGTQAGLAASAPTAWTLNDQFGVARTAVAQNQKSQVIGGAGYTAFPVQANLWSSGGVSGNASQAVQLVFSVNNPANVGGVPDPTYPAPTVIGSAEMLSLAAGWTST